MCTCAVCEHRKGYNWFGGKCTGQLSNCNNRSAKTDEKFLFFSHPICVLEDERERDGKGGKERVF